jgi:signal transduction histidine kinase
MKLSSVFAPPRRFSGPIAVALCVSAAVLVWIGYRSVREWQRAAGAAAMGRAQTAADLLQSAITRDMRGLLQVVATTDRHELAEGEPIDLLPVLGSAFARYPYPEAFFSWKNAATPASVTFFTRVDRVPTWLSLDTARTLTPVAFATEPALARRLLERVGQDATLCRRLSAFDIQVGDVPYQAVAAIFYGTARCDHVTGVVGFLVNLAWVRRVYFHDLTEQIAHLDGNPSSERLLVLDEQNAIVAGGAEEVPLPGTLAARAFTLAFFDPLTVELDPPLDLRLPTWTAAAVASDDPALVAAEEGAKKTLVIDAAMSFVLLTALVVTARAARASADLAEMRSEFVSAVTHELKTPIANIRAINETLASGRGSEEMSRDYAELAINETKRLSRLIDNLLAYAKINDVTDAYVFESVSLDALARGALAELAGQLTQASFSIDVDIPQDLPDVRADPTALGLALSNVIDNAIRYSTDTRHLRIAASRQAAGVQLVISDRGSGIPVEELPRVTRKFFRGRAARSGGSGLGLAIVDRIVTAHGGTLEIRSQLGVGTTVSVTLPLWKRR